MPKRTLAREALYSSENFDVIRYHGNASPDFIPSMVNAAERMRRLDPDGSVARIALECARTGNYEPLGEALKMAKHAKEDRSKALLDLIEKQ